VIDMPVLKKMYRTNPLHVARRTAFAAAREAR
jgi:hypothetical protein